jgi:hypothetical protein
MHPRFSVPIWAQECKKPKVLLQCETKFLPKRTWHCWRAFPGTWIHVSSLFSQKSTFPTPQHPKKPRPIHLYSPLLFNPFDDGYGRAAVANSAIEESADHFSLIGALIYTTLSDSNTKYSYGSSHDRR